LDRIDDWRQAFADQGYFVLGTRCRNKQDMQIVVEVLEKQLGRRIDIDRLFSTESPYMPQIRIPNEIVMTTQMRRMLILCSEAWKCNEPVILVGDTGCGKTTSVHLFVRKSLLIILNNLFTFKGSLLSINCHERTDTADLLGSIRPIPGGGGFQWQDGIVLQAMRNGRRLLIDEISLAPDSVLERLNSLLEPERTILLTDAGAGSNGFEQLIKAMPDFQLVATMNPGNDYGKKEVY
jgi:midasin